ncbi:MAG: hypothetical protein ABI586_04500 [Candidatus Nanopelagicales bacterium]
MADGGGLVGFQGRTFCAAIALSAAVMFALSGCQDRGATADFQGPDDNELVIGYLTTCPEVGGPSTSARNASIIVSASDFMPETTVTLRWSVEATGADGSWESVVTEADGTAKTRLRLPTDQIKSGDMLEVWAQGNSDTGIKAARGVVPIGSCLA